MAIALLRRLNSGTATYAFLAVLLLIFAYLLSVATQDSSRLNDLFLTIFGVGSLCLFLLFIILARSFYRLYRDYRNKQAGSRLTLRLATFFTLLLLVATSIVYGFSVHFLHRGINSWFDIKIEKALDDSLILSRTSFGIRLRLLLRQTRMMAKIVSEQSAANTSHSLREMTSLSGASEMSIWTQSGKPIASSIESPDIILPDRPSDSIIHQVIQGDDYIGLDPVDKGNLQLRATVKLPNQPFDENAKILNVLFPIGQHLSDMGQTVQKAYTDYKELKYLRKPLITIFTLSLSLIVLLTTLLSIWFSIWFARRIVTPLQRLSEATRSIAIGNYNTQISNAKGNDEIAFLVSSFNQMTQNLIQARNTSQKNHQLLEQQTSYLSTVLGSLSSGVVTIDQGFYLRTANEASSQILEARLPGYLGYLLSELALLNHNMDTFYQMIKNHAETNKSWDYQIDLQKPKGRQTLICHGTKLPNNSGWVIVFEDITALLQAQRSSAWGEVARRLAHEIKNPLTPIQLSAERLQKKYGQLIPASETDNMQKLTGTIVQQVESMKEMVDEFSEYARTPALELQQHNIEHLIREVLALYEGSPNHQYTLINNTSNHSIMINIDANRFRQILHNLLKNAIDASDNAELPVKIEISYQKITAQQSDWLELSLRDYGPGIPTQIIDRLFEPYITTKHKGSGLGLAIVKKIIDEHGGQIWSEDLKTQGAMMVIRLPLESVTYDG